MNTVLRRIAWLGALAVAASARAQDEAPAAGLVTRQPELIEFAEATLPEPFASMSGSVLLDLVIGPDGAVEETTVLESAGPELDAAAQEAVRRFVFAPGEVDGVPARFRVHYRYEFLGLGDEVIVHAATRRAEAVSTRVVADEARDLPGTTGDVVRAVENLGGVARASLGSGALVVWGAAPEDTTVLVDGVPVPRLYHDGGLRSVVGSDLVGAVDLVPGGYGAAWGRGLGALVSVETRTFDEGLHGSVSADLYDGAVSLHGRVGERLELGLAGRAGWVGPLLTAFRPGVGDVFPIPSYRDAQARIGVRLRAGERLDVLGLASSDRTERTAPSADPARVASDERRLAFQRVAARYERDQGDGTALSALVFAGADQAEDAARFGLVETSASTRVALGGARATWRRRVTPAVDVEVGLDALVQATDAARHGSVAMPPREGDVRVFGQPPPDRIATDGWRVVTVNVAPHAAVEAGLLDERLHVVAGLRFDPYARSVSHAAPKNPTGPETGLFLHDPRLEPRLSVRFAPTEVVWVTPPAASTGSRRVPGTCRRRSATRRCRRPAGRTGSWAPARARSSP